MKQVLFSFFLCFLFSNINIAQKESTRLLRNPAISQNHITFIYGGDLWLANIDGSDVKRLTAFQGVEADPHFSPDGQTIAFTGEYDGNIDVYVLSISGGEPQRLTWHPGADYVVGWTNDGQRVLFASGRTRAPIGIQDQLWTVSLKGETPTRFIIPRAINGKFSPDGSAFVFEKIFPWETEFRNYRGGQNTPLRIFDLKTYAVEKLPWENSRDIHPVWMGNTIYFLSDRDLAMNIWAFDTQNKKLRQVTTFKDFDCKNLEGHAGNLIFENGGQLHIWNEKTQQAKRLNISVKGDFPWSRPHWTEVKDNLESAAISPTGKRIIIGARGDVFTVPAQKGNWRNLTNSPGSAERAVSWSPDGKTVSWFSDEGGEYQLVIADQFGNDQRKIKIDQPTFYYKPSWSPDSKYLSFYNENRTLWIADIESGKLTQVDNEGFAHPQHIIYAEWSPDSKWIAYTKRLENQYGAIFLHSLEQQKSFQLTDGMSDCKSPAWDKSGKYLYFTASTDYGLNVGWLDMTSYDRPTSRGIYMAVLSKKTANPLAPESDEEEVEAKKDKNKKEKEGEKKEAEKEDEEKEEVKPVEIDIDGLSQRIVALGLAEKDYQQLETGKDGVLLFTEQEPGKQGLTLFRFTHEKREAEKVVEGINVFEISADGSKYMYLSTEDQIVISDPSGAPSPEKETLNLSNIKIKIDPPKEWQQIFREAWRYQRDYFYVDNVHGLDMDWAYKTYAPWVNHVKHRSDLNYLLDIFSGETAIGHSFVGGGDYPDVDRVPVGLLGADYDITNKRFRIKKIYTGESWNPDLRSPLSGPGIDVSEGDYLLAINGQPIDASTNLFAHFDQTSDKQIFITVNDQPSMTNAREVIVNPVRSEGQLRQYEWVENNRRKVDELSNGQLAYVWLPNTGKGGYDNFNRYYFAQIHKKGAVIDERYNGGGSAADYMVDLLGRKIHGYFNNPIGDRQPFTSPNGGIWGPKVMIINEMAGSGGDLLPYMFRFEKIGPLVGTTTWGGLVGIWDVPSLIDGGGITAPRGGFYNLKGEWDVENIGVAPDIMVEQTAKEVINGKDPQLERAISECLKLLKQQKVELLKQPKDPVRSVRPQ
jgi:tricorn protease